jgi:hypothetical protein
VKVSGDNPFVNADASILEIRPGADVMEFIDISPPNHRSVEFIKIVICVLSPCSIIISL